MQKEDADCTGAEQDHYDRFVAPGHYYSPVPSINEVLENEKRIWKEEGRNIPGIDLFIEDQFMLLEEFKAFYNELPFRDDKTPGLRYYFLNPSYSYSDAIFLYCMIRHAKPNKIIEAGSGFSSCVTLDTNELFFGNRIECTFIDPYPELLKSLVKPGDSIKITGSVLQDVPLCLFRELKENDILFIDSTHVSKIGSDVNYIIHEILPCLDDGVYVHFHDIFYNFEYPKEWILEGRAWNEQYILRAFLECNDSFKIILFNTYLEYFYKEKLIDDFPLVFKNTGGSLWIRKVKRMPSHIG
jgi:hypothetical protein